MAGVERLMARVRSMLARAVVRLVDDGRKLQALQIQVHADRAVDEAEHFQSYGFTSVAHPGAEGIALALGGSTAHTVVINVDDRRYRLKGLAAGDVALYDDLGHKVHLTRSGIVIDGAGQLVKLINLAKLRVEANIEGTGEIKDHCDAPQGRTMQQMRDVHNGHNHTENNVLGGPTSGPSIGF